MKNNKGFTLIELLAVIVVLAIVTVLATRSILPFMSDARVDAFEIEAANVVKSAEDALSFYNLGEVNLKNNTASCRKNNEICFNVAELIDLGIYQGDKESFKGKVMIDVTNPSVPTYELYLQKGAEFNIIAGEGKDYTDSTYINDGGWISISGVTEAKVTEYSTCSCS